MKKTKGSPYKNTPEQIKEKSDNLLSIISIIDSEAKDYEKVYQICKIYKNAEAFRKAYGLIVKFGKKDPMFNQYIDKINEIHEQLIEYEKRGIIANVNYIIDKEHYLNNYKYAKFIIESFIASDHSYLTTTFFEEMGIDKEIFKYCLDTARELDLSLIDRYNQKVEEDKKNRYLANIYTFRNLANGIRTGFLFDGTPFDELMFWKLVPFKYSHGKKTEFIEYSKINDKIFYRSDNFYGQIENFTEATIPLADSKTILGYMKCHRMYSYRYVSEQQFRNIYSGNPIFVKNVYGAPTKIDSPEEALRKINNNQVDSLIRRTTFTIDDANNVLEYMKLHKLPSLIEVFKLVQDKYIRGEINMDEEYKKVKEKPAQRILIP